MALQLRDYQRELVDKCREAFRAGHRSIILQMPTGSGKTPCAGAVAQGLAANGLSLLALVHRQELVGQFALNLDRAGLGGRYGIIASGRAPSPWAPFQVGSIPTIYRRRFMPDVIDLKPHMVVVDEAHHVRAGTWDAVLALFPNALLLGLTATPARLDGKPLGGRGGRFQHLIEGPSIQWLVAHGWSAPITLKYAGRGILTRGVKKTAGDYNRRDLGERVNHRAVVAPVAAFEKHAADRRAIFFGVNRQDSERVANLFRERGIKAAHVDGKTPTDTRERIIDEFREGHLQVLCNVDIVSEGTDIPMCDCILMGLPTKSVVRYLQAAGRGVRVDHGRDCVFIDLVGNVWRHGAPDIDRHWRIDGAEPEESEKAAETRVTMRVCVHCATVYPGSRGACPSCGREQPLEIPKHLDVELLTRDGDTSIAPGPRNRMAELRSELRKLLRAGGGRAEIRELRDRYGMSTRWERNAVETFSL